MGTENRLGFWLRWVLANALGELAGLGLVFLAVSGVAVLQGDAPGLPPALAGLLVLAGTLEGLALGVGQWWAVRRLLLGLSGGRWVLLTMLGGFLAWLAAIGLSTLLRLDVQSWQAAGLAALGERPYALAAGAGGAAGLVVGLSQWLVLRRWLPRAGWWMPANILAWALGIPQLFVCSGMAPPGTSELLTLASTGAGLLAAGAVSGAVSGLALLWLLARRHSPARAAGPI